MLHRAVKYSFCNDCILATQNRIKILKFHVELLILFEDFRPLNSAFDQFILTTFVLSGFHCIQCSIQVPPFPKKLTTIATPFLSTIEHAN